MAIGSILPADPLGTRTRHLVVCKGVCHRGDLSTATIVSKGAIVTVSPGRSNDGRESESDFLLLAELEPADTVGRVKKVWEELHAEP